MAKKQKLRIPQADNYQRINYLYQVKRIFHSVGMIVNYNAYCTAAAKYDWYKYKLSQKA